MEVTDLQGYSGMAFVYEEDVQNSFYMRNTPMPLSIAWIAADGSVVTITDMEPCEDRDGCPSYAPAGPYRYAIEVPQGDARRRSASPSRRRSPSAAAARRPDARRTVELPSAAEGDAAGFEEPAAVDGREAHAERERARG